MVTVDRVKKSWKNAVLAKYAANYWLTYDRSGKHGTNFNYINSTLIGEWRNVY